MKKQYSIVLVLYLLHLHLEIQSSANQLHFMYIINLAYTVEFMHMGLKPPSYTCIVIIIHCIN